MYHEIHRLSRQGHRHISDETIEAHRSKLSGNRVYELSEANALTGFKQPENNLPVLARNLM